MKKKLLYIAVALSLGLASCSPYKSLSSNRFEKLLTDESIQLVDVRTPEEYAEGHIPGSLNIDVKNKETFPVIVDSLLDNSHKIAVYCRSGVRSRTAADQLVQKGFKVYNLNKGFRDWTKNKKEIEK